MGITTRPENLEKEKNGVELISNIACPISRCDIIVGLKVLHLWLLGHFATRVSQHYTLLALMTRLRPDCKQLRTASIFLRPEVSWSDFCIYTRVLAVPVHQHVEGYCGY